MRSLICARVHGRVDRDIAALGVAGEHDARVRPESAHLFEIVGGLLLRGHRVGERHVEILAPAGERIIGAAERDEQRAVGQLERLGGVLGLLRDVETLLGGAHAGDGEPRIAFDRAVEAVRGLIVVGEAGMMLPIGVGELVFVQSFLHLAQRGSREWRAPQCGERTARVFEIEVAQLAGDGTEAFEQGGELRDLLRDLVIAQNRVDQRVGNMERVFREVARLLRHVVDDRCHIALRLITSIVGDE